MNFTKYASAAALLATTVYAAATVEPLKAEDLVTAFTDCETETTVVDIDSLITCMVDKKKIERKYAEEAAKHRGKILEKTQAENIIKDVNERIDAARNQNPPPAPEGGWYEHMTEYKWSYGIGIPIAAVVICGGIYMAVGRKPADDADL